MDKRDLPAPITSYAQNFEDVMLWRALGHIAHGQYVDVGAQDPTVDSVSKAFYLRGWRGVHVEPVPSYARQLELERQEDIVLQAAVGAEAGVETFYEVQRTGLSTRIKQLADDYANRGLTVVELTVPRVTLDQIFERIEGEIHWLKIDVERAEFEVISGWNGPCRPWIVVIESVVPSGSERVDQEWEAMLLARGYELRYFDGVNGYYVHQEHIELHPALVSPPNVNDQFELSGTSTASFCNGLNARNEALIQEMATIEKRRTDEVWAANHAARLATEEMRGEIDTLERKVADAEGLARTIRGEFMEREIVIVSERAVALAQATRLQHQMTELHESVRHRVWEAVHGVSMQRDDALEQLKTITDQLNRMSASTSWKVTAPLRFLMRGARAAFRMPGRLFRLLVRLAKRLVMGGITILLRCIDKSPSLKAGGIGLIRRYPTLETRVARWHAVAMGKNPDLRVNRNFLVENYSGPISTMGALPEHISESGRRTLERIRALASGMEQK